MAKKKWTPEQQEIADLDAAWSEAANKKLLRKVVSFYSREGYVLWPDLALTDGQGTQKITAAWKGSFKAIKGMSLTFEPVRIDIAESGDLATDMGVVKLGHQVPSGEKRVELAKYVVVWRRERGGWKVLYDCWNYMWPAR